MWTEIDRMATEDFALRKAAEEGEARGMAKVIKAWLSNGVQAQVIARVWDVDKTYNIPAAMKYGYF